MKFHLFLAVGGEDFSAEEFKRSVGIADGTVRQIGQRGAQADPGRFRAWMIWESARMVGSNEPGDDVLNLLAKNQAVTRLLKEERWAGTSRWVGVVGYYTDSDGPRGFAFDEKVVRAVADIGASIKIDMVVDPEEVLKQSLLNPSG